MFAWMRHPLYRLVCHVVVVLGILSAIDGYFRHSRDYYNGLIVCVVGLGGLAAPFVIYGFRQKPPKD